MQDLLTEHNQLRKDLTEAIKILKGRGIDKAEKYASYRLIRATKTLILIDQSYAVTVTQDIVRGDPKVAEAKKESDIAEVLYETAKQKIYQIKLEMATIEQQMKWERYGE